MTEALSCLIKFNSRSSETLFIVSKFSQSKYVSSFSVLSSSAGVTCLAVPSDCIPVELTLTVVGDMMIP